jgi:plasmid rolling circle replication initiator protein Rep
MLQTYSTQSELVCLTDFSPSEKPWDTHGAERDQVQELYKRSRHPYADRMTTCSQLLDFALKFQPDTEELKARLQSARFCRVRFCPVCQWRRMLRLRAKFLQTIPRVITDFPTYRFLFLTLTVRNCDLNELRSTVSLMNKAWSKMSRDRCPWWPGVGWVRSLEVTRSTDGTAHPHFHALLMVPASYFSYGYITQAQWTDYWKKAMKLDYTPIVHVKPVKPRPGATENEGMASALCEVIKYSTKPADLYSDESFLLGITKQLHKTRAIATGGLLKDYLKVEEWEDEDDLVHVDGEEDTGEVFATFLAHWNTKVKRYQIKE